MSVLEHSILKQGHAIGRKTLSLVCHAIIIKKKKQQHILSDGGKKGLGNKNKKCRRFDMGNIMPGCRYVQTANLGHVLLANT